MAQAPGSSVGAKEAARGIGEPPLEAWTWEGYHHRTSLPGAAKLETAIEKIKGINVSSVDEVVRAVNCIKLARQDLVYLKGARTWIVLGVVVSGFTLGATGVVPLRRKKQEEIQQ